MNEKVDAYLLGLKNWKAEAEELRTLLLATALVEDFKWGRPCYTYNGKNIIGLTPLKEHCALNFFNGAVLSDTNGVLIMPGEHTQNGRWMKFDSLSDIKKHKSLLKLFIKEAIEIENSGLKQPKILTTITLPEELQSIFKKDAKLNKSFHSLTPGRQRAYLIYFTAAKQSETRIARIKKYAPKILCGKGFHDCDCGLSKRMPICDGSHKFAKK